MLRTLMVTEASSGGTGRHLIDLMGGLKERGCSVALAYSPHRTDAVFREFLTGCDWARTRAMPMHRGPHWSDARVLHSLRRFARQAGPFDIVHGHSSKAGLLVRTVGLPGKPAVLYTPHGIYTNNQTNGRPSRLIARFIERGLGARCDAVVAVSVDERDHLLSLGISPRKVCYVPNGVRPFKPQRATDVRALLGLDDGLVIGFIGRLAKEKDPILLIEAFHLLAPRLRNVQLAIVGEGPLAGACRDRVAVLGLEHRVHWLGFRRAEEVLPAFDVLAIPSRSESMPYVLLEALSAGVPVVACAVGGMKEVIRDLRNGVLVRGHEPEPFSSALDRVLGDDGLRLYMAVQAEKSARDFAADRMVDRTLALYHRLTRSRTRRTDGIASVAGPLGARGAQW